MLKFMMTLIFLIGSLAWADNNVEVKAKLTHDDENYLYMESPETKYTIIKKGSH